MKERKGSMHTPSAAAATPAPEGFTDAEWEKLERFQAEKERRRIAAERFKAGLTTEKILLRNETGNPRSLPFGCTFDAHELAKEIRCDLSDPVCRLRANKPVAAPGELFTVPPGHRRGALNPALPEVDPASVADEPTLQDRLLLGEFRSFEQRAEAPANLAARTLTDLEAQRKILDERILQQQEELERRQSHVQAAKVRAEEFLGSRSPAWKEALLAGTAEQAIEAAKKAAEAEDRRNSANLSHQGGGRRLQAGEAGADAFAAGPGGVVALPVMRRS